MAAWKDHPEEDPNVIALDGFDITSLSVDGLKKAGILLEPKIIVVDKTCTAVVSHSTYAKEARAHDITDRAYARLSARTFASRTGTLEGLRLQRSFPCLGVFRAAPTKDFMQCDLCGDELGLPFGVPNFTADPVPGYDQTPFDV